MRVQIEKKVHFSGDFETRVNPVGNRLSYDLFSGGKFLLNRAEISRKQKPASPKPPSEKRDKGWPNWKRICSIHCS
jgi:hypothetical protein